MQIVEIIALLFSIRKLRKENAHWEEVHKVYLLCVRLIILISVLRCITDGLLCILIITSIAHVMSHQVVVSYLMDSPLYKTIYDFYQFIFFHKRPIVS